MISLMSFSSDPLFQWGVLFGIFGVAAIATLIFSMLIDDAALSDDILI